MREPSFSIMISSIRGFSKRYLWVGWHPLNQSSFVIVERRETCLQCNAFLSSGTLVCCRRMDLSVKEARQAAKGLHWPTLAGTEAKVFSARTPLLRYFPLVNTKRVRFFPLGLALPTCLYEKRHLPTHKLKAIKKKNTRTKDPLGVVREYNGPNFFLCRTEVLFFLCRTG